MHFFNYIKKKTKQKTVPLKVSSAPLPQFPLPGPPHETSLTRFLHASACVLFFLMQQKSILFSLFFLKQMTVTHYSLVLQLHGIPLHK